MLDLMCSFQIIAWTVLQHLWFEVFSWHTGYGSVPVVPDLELQTSEGFTPPNVPKYIFSVVELHLHLGSSCGNVEETCRLVPRTLAPPVPPLQWYIPLISLCANTCPVSYLTCRGPASHFPDCSSLYLVWWPFWRLQFVDYLLSGCCSLTASVSLTLRLFSILDWLVFVEFGLSTGEFCPIRFENLVLTWRTEQPFCVSCVVTLSSVCRPLDITTFHHLNSR